MPAGLAEGARLQEIREPKEGHRGERACYNKSAILDGEIVCLDPQGRSQFYDLMFRRGQPYFYAFDLLWLDGEDLRELPLLERKTRLKELILERPSLQVNHRPSPAAKFSTSWVTTNP